MKKICLLTSEESFLTNFGAALQGYALYQTITLEGYNVDIQRYKGGEIGLSNISTPRIPNMVMYNPFEVYLKCLFRIGKLLNKTKVGIQYKRFKDFQDKHMSFYPGERKNWLTIKNDPPIADIYVCGSDQIWNPMFKNGYNDRGYFLAFTKGKKIAYAPSFGVSDIPETAQKDLEELLASFDHISVREKDGAIIIKKYAHKEVPVVLDPTLLLTDDEWRKIQRFPRNIPKKYILCYRFGNSYSVDKEIKRISKSTGLPIVELPLSGISYFNSNRIRCFEAGPAEFIGLISRASLVLTDSFHATVFSIIMQTPFVTFLRSNNKKKSEGMNSRVTNLLNMLGLSNRIYRDNNAIADSDLFNIDFSIAKKSLNTQRTISKEWLISALRGNE